MNLREIDSFTKSLFTTNKEKIKSSSSFIVFAYYIHSKFYQKLAERIKPILKLEHSNREVSWTANAIYSHDQCLKMESQELYDLMIAYRIVLDYFLNDDIVSKLFRMDEEDTLGWKIYKELDSKYIWCKRRIDILNYKQETQNV